MEPSLVKGQIYDEIHIMHSKSNMETRSKCKRRKYDYNKTSTNRILSTAPYLCSCSEDKKYVIAKIKRFNQQLNEFSEMENIYMCINVNCQSSKGDDSRTKIVIFHLNQGGRLTLYPKLVGDSERQDVSTYMDQCNIFRQYRINGFREPRIHVLLSSNAKAQNEVKGPGYKYHGVKMKALPLQIAPPIENLSKSLGKRFNVKNGIWNIGVDLILYRDGKDRIGWHADDTQGEQIILTVAIETDPERIVQVRPKNGKNECYEDGDELIELIVNQGDAYSMDSTMQHHYEHCVPAKPECNSKRKVLVFRHSKKNICIEDNGKVTSVTQQACRPKRIWYGHPAEESNVSVGALYSRVELSDLNLHDNILGGICGSKAEGCSSIIISNRFPNRYEVDTYKEFLYSAPKRLAHSLIKSYRRQLPIRVFRSSRCTKFAPSSCKMKPSALYRYDGLYIVTSYFNFNDTKGEEFFVFKFLLDCDPSVLNKKHDEFQIRAAVSLLEMKSSKNHVMNK